MSRTIEPCRLFSTIIQGLSSNFLAHHTQLQSYLQPISIPRRLAKGIFRIYTPSWTEIPGAAACIMHPAEVLSIGKVWLVKSPDPADAPRETILARVSGQVKAWI